jgi:hypothetical protein
MAGTRGLAVWCGGLNSSIDGDGRNHAHSAKNERVKLFANQQVLREGPFLIDPLPLTSITGPLRHF